MAAAYDVIIVGGGPAGLNAALYLGRGRRKVLLCDAGAPRNAAAQHMHGFGTRDGIAPREFRRISREQLQRYPSVEVRDTRVGAVEKRDGGFRAMLGDGATVEARRLLLAVGMVDVVPDIPGCRELWGTSIYQCPYCHGWEAREQPFGVLALDPGFMEMGVVARNWSGDVVVFTGGAYPVPPEQRERFHHLGIQLEERKLRAFHGKDGHLEAVELEDGTRVPRRAMFAAPPQRQPELVKTLGLELDEMGYVKVNAVGETSVPGISAAGDTTTRLQTAIFAASAGGTAGAMMCNGLILEDADRQYTAATGKPPPPRPKMH